jgi:predicted RNase H-like HicB family nuclease
MTFMVNLICDSEYKGYVVEVPGLKGCMSQGKTVESALKNIKEAIQLFLETEEVHLNEVP